MDVTSCKTEYLSEEDQPVIAIFHLESRFVLNSNHIKRIRRRVTLGSADVLLQSYKPHNAYRAQTVLSWSYLLPNVGKISFMDKVASFASCRTSKFHSQFFTRWVWEMQPLDWWTQREAGSRLQSLWFHFHFIAFFILLSDFFKHQQLILKCFEIFEIVRDRKGCLLSQTFQWCVVTFTLLSPHVAAQISLIHVSFLLPTSSNQNLKKFG